MLNKFAKFWREEIRFEKKLSMRELSAVRADISRLNELGKLSSQIIVYLQRKYPKLSEAWKAERAYWTETKRMQTTEVKDDAEELEIDKFRVLPNINACPICIKLSGNGKKIFSKKSLDKEPPYHPNCYCILLPVLD